MLLGAAIGETAIGEQKGLAAAFKALWAFVCNLPVLGTGVN